MRDFKNLRIWQKSHSLVLKVYDASQAFPEDELYGVTSQLRQAAVAIASKIAEGSVYATPEKSRLIGVSLGAAKEVEGLLMITHDLGYLPSSDFHELYAMAIELQSLLIGYHNYLQKKH